MSKLNNKYQREMKFKTEKMVNDKSVTLGQYFFFILIRLRVDLLGFVGVITMYDTRVVLQYSRYYFPPLPLQHESVCLKDRSHLCTTQITEFKVC